MESTGNYYVLMVADGHVTVSGKLCGYTEQAAMDQVRDMNARRTEPSWVHFKLAKEIDSGS